ncbi:MAG: hypothetical protein GOMPHAMPRED_000311 [Gomphillus americanus]|uniref:Uncharacterized protein n=1 Tax=Gomphillus americanus TaxID=1940652 RepID=A0A8H3ED84_9LECA|nr:MAG: hypothetical protein GOMPHAMPRED_000311 [Gomphillus americanus]
MTHIHSPEPKRVLKRKVQELDQTESLFHNKRVGQNQPILGWLSSIEPVQPRPLNAPPFFDLTVDSRYASKPHIMPQEADMSREFARPSAPALTNQSSFSTKMKPEQASYPQILWANGICMNRSGKKMPKGIRDFVEKNITKKERSSPPLVQEELDKIIHVAEDIADSSDAHIQDLLHTEMFPLRDDRVASNGGLPFSSELLPHLPDAFYELATPMPDKFCGYRTGPKGIFSRPQYSVLSHPYMAKYALPTLDIAFPFLVIKTKSEAKGGTLWHAMAR